MTTPTPDLIILRYGEISLKTSYVRTLFETRLITNIRHALTHNDIPHTISKERGRIYIHTPHITQTLPILAHTSGLVTYSPAIQTTTDLATLTTITTTLAISLLTPTTSFALRITRTGTHPYTSQDAARTIGDAIVKATQAPVNLTTPDMELYIEIRGRRAYLFTHKTRSIGGLPVGTQGTVAALITQPHDILAAWYMMHRGCTILPILTTTHLLTAVTDFLTTWNLQATPITIDPTTPDYHDRLHTLTTDHHCDAIATGTTLSHTTHTLKTITDLKAHLDLPILTPLIALTDDEIQTQCTQQEIHT